MFETVYERRRRAQDALAHLGTLPAELRKIHDELLEAQAEAAAEDREPGTLAPHDLGVRTSGDATAPFTNGLAAAMEAVEAAINAVSLVHVQAKSVRRTPVPAGPHAAQEWDATEQKPADAEPAEAVDAGSADPA